MCSVVMGENNLFHFSKRKGKSTYKNDIAMCYIIVK